MTDGNAALVGKYFEELCQIPRGSGNEAGARRWVRTFAETHGFGYAEDAVGNCVVAVPGRGTGAKAGVVILQSHTDMVCVKAEGSSHDFTRDPIRTQIVQWEENGHTAAALTADGTTLGADNGIGVAAAMAVATDPEVTDCPPLELLFTVDEETGLTGARYLDTTLLHSDLLINMDTEELGDICVSCAGGRDMTTVWRVSREEPQPNEIPVRLSLSGLPGGHSGVEIHQRHGNAIQMLLKELMRLTELRDVLKLAAFKGGSARNVIPSDAEIVVWLPEAQATALETAFRDPLLLACIEAELIPGAAGKALYGCERLPGETALRPLSVVQTQTLLAAIGGVPHGVQQWSQVVENLVETSNNVAVMTTSEETLTLICSTRSSRDGAIAEFQETARKSLEASGATVTFSDGYPGWPADPDNPLLRLAEETFTEVLGHAPNVMAVHAGLECGVFKGKQASLQMISFGPDIRAAHTIHERVLLESIPPFYACLTSLLRRLSD